MGDFTRPQSVSDLQAVMRAVLGVPSKEEFAAMSPEDQVMAMAMAMAGTTQNVGGKIAGRAVKGAAKALPMDEASRLARAKRLGFGVDAYHGSGRSFNAFDPAAQPTTAGGLRRYGTFVSEDPSVASRYATDFNPQQGAQVYPLKVRVAKPLDLSATDFYGLQRYVEKIDSGEALNEVQDVSLDMLLEKHGVKRKPGQHPIEAIQSAGHDAIRSDAGRHGTAERELLVFDPANMRSKFAKFDPSNVGKPDLMGAALPAILAAIAAGSGAGLAAYGVTQSKKGKK